jgi:molecular chaperone HscB
VFDLDPSQLEQTYKGLQKQLHPDKFSTASSLEQEYAHQQVG